MNSIISDVVQRDNISVAVHNSSRTPQYSISLQTVCILSVCLYVQVCATVNWIINDSCTNTHTICEFASDRERSVSLECWYVKRHPSNYKLGPGIAWHSWLRCLWSKLNMRLLNWGHYSHLFIMIAFDRPSINSDDIVPKIYYSNNDTTIPIMQNVLLTWGYDNTEVSKTMNYVKESCQLGLETRKENFLNDRSPWLCFKGLHLPYLTF